MLDQRLAERGDMRVRSFAVEQHAAELLFQPFIARVSDGCETLHFSAASRNPTDDDGKERRTDAFP